MKITNYFDGLTANCENNNLLTFGSKGKNLVSTSYFTSDYAKMGLFYLSMNAGGGRLLVPDSAERWLHEILSSDYVILTRGQWHGEPGYELLFEDNSDEPFMFHLSSASFDRLLPESEDGIDLPLLVYVDGGDAPLLITRKATRFRTAPQLPWMKPIARRPVIADE